jgi:hypothetical protein
MKSPAVDSNYHPLFNYFEIERASLAMTLSNKTRAASQYLRMSMMMMMMRWLLAVIRPVDDGKTTKLGGGNIEASPKVGIIISKSIISLSFFRLPATST